MSGAVLTLLGGGNAASAVTITLDALSIYGYASSPATASAVYQINSNGSVYENINGAGYTFRDLWCVPASEAIYYECYASLVTGTLSGGSAATGTWLALSTTREWNVSQSTAGSKYTVINVGIRRAGTTTILASADIELFAYRF